MALLDSSVGGMSRAANFEDVADVPQSTVADTSRELTVAEILETFARDANAIVLWFCELATFAAVAVGLVMVFEVTEWKQFAGATSITLFLTVAACVGAYVLMLRSNANRDRL